MIKTKKVILTV